MKKLNRVFGALPPLFVALLGFACNSITFDSALYSDDAWIARNGDSFSYISKTQSSNTEEATVNFKGFYGKHSVWSFEADSSCELALDLILSSDLTGRYKVCFIAADGQVMALENSPGSSSHVGITEQIYFSLKLPA